MTQTRVLLFVPAVVPSENQTALRIAQLLAQSATKSRDGTYTVETSPKSTRAVVRDPAGKSALVVIQVDYNETLLGPTATEANPKHTKPADALHALQFALFATWRLIAVIFSSQKSKSRNARWQIFIACFLVGLLWLSFLGLVVVVLASLPLDDLGISWFDWVPSWLTDSTVVATGAVGLLVLLYWRVRDPVLQLGQRLRAIMGYAERQDDLLRVTAIVDQTIDDVFEEMPDAVLHLFGFSFGSIALLDTLFPSKNRVVERRDLGAVASLTTVGSPADFLRLLYPDHFDDRDSRLPEPTPWTNVYIPADVLGSNFLRDGDDISEESATGDASASADIAAVLPTHNVAVGRQQIKKRSMVSMDGFAVHGRYWARNEPRHLEGLMPNWLPPSERPPS